MIRPVEKGIVYEVSAGMPPCMGEVDYSFSVPSSSPPLDRKSLLGCDSPDQLLAARSH
jgi:hypothetical protein